MNISHNQSLTNDPPYSLNRDHGSIGCYVIDQVSLILGRCLNDQITHVGHDSDYQISKVKKNPKETH